VILGTAAYMAPEQARGKAVDRRADIWAFGVVLYEMLTGRRMFEGETVSDTIAAILTRSPDYGALPSNTPASVRRLLERCLDRDPKQRLRDIGEARIMLGSAATSAETAAATPSAVQPRARGSILPWIVAGLAVAGAAAWVFTTSSGPGTVPSVINYAQKTYTPQTIFQALYAPDGQTIVYSAATGGSTPYLYSLRSEFTEPLKVSPDPLQLLSISSRGELAVLTDPHWIAHRLCAGTLARMPLGGGAPRQIMEHVAQAVWAPDGNDLAISHEAGGVWRLEYPAGHVLYQTGAYISDLRFSPDGKHIAYFEHPFRFDDRGGVAVVDLKGKRTLLSDGYWGEEGIAWSTDGSTVYYSAGTGYADFSIYAVTLDGKVRVAAQSAGGLVIHDIAPNGEWLATRDDLTRVMLSGVAGGSERDISWQDLSYPSAISADGRTVLFTESGTSAGNNYQVCIRGSDGSGVVVLGEGGCDRSQRRRPLGAGGHRTESRDRISDGPRETHRAPDEDARKRHRCALGERQAGADPGRRRGTGATSLPARRGRQRAAARHTNGNHGFRAVAGWNARSDHRRGSRLLDRGDGFVVHAHRGERNIRQDRQRRGLERGWKDPLCRRSHSRADLDRRRRSGHGSTPRRHRAGAEGVTGTLYFHRADHSDGSAYVYDAVTYLTRLYTMKGAR
jgi:Tol biopolymer transport system component